MTIETYPEMNARIVDLLRWNEDNTVLLYAAQRIEELERAADVKSECLEIATKALYWYGHNCPVLLCGKAGETLDTIEARLAELEPESPCEGCGNQGSRVLFGDSPATGNALCWACEGYNRKIELEPEEETA